MPRPCHALSLFVACQRFEHVQRQIEPIRFFGIDGEAHVRLRGSSRQGSDDRHQPLHHQPFVHAGRNEVRSADSFTDKLERSSNGVPLRWEPMASSACS